MSTRGAISEMGYVAIRTTDLEASVNHAVDSLGISVTEHSADKAYLSACDTHHELVYIQDEANSVDHFGVIASDRAELEGIRVKVDEAGLRVVSEVPLESGIEAGFAFIGPDGWTWQVYLPVHKLERRLGTAAVDRYGHINLKSPDPRVMRDFLVEVFDMRVSDQIGDDFAFFIRCNSDHHGIGIIKGEVQLHHHAWQVPSTSELAQIGDRLARAGKRVIYGPVRHGAGHNVAIYFPEPSGGVIEVYTDLERVFQKEREPVRWDFGAMWWSSLWSGHRSPEMDNYRTVPFPR